MTMTKGSSGPEVEQLQLKLQQLGLYRHKTDGFFGRHTREAVFTFQERYFTDGIVNATTATAIDNAVKAWKTDVQELLLPVPHGLDEIQKQFGTIEYEDTVGGYIWITSSWEAENIVHADLPVIGVHSVHKRMVPVFTAVLTEIEKRGLDRLIEMFLCWCPRHQRHDPQLPLSTHSWAISCDINPASNQPGTRGDMDPGIVEVFERHGFVWGGRWKRYPDPMHFQLATGV